jgi:hypothetical protein
VNDLARPGFLFVDLFRTGCLCSKLPFGPCRQADDDGGRRDPKECLLHLYTGHDLAWPNCLEADEIEIYDVNRMVRSTRSKKQEDVLRIVRPA